MIAWMNQTIELRFRPPRDRNNAAYYKPVAEDNGRGPSLWVNQAFVDGYFQGLKPEQTRLTLTRDGGRRHRHAVDHHPGHTEDSLMEMKITLRFRPSREKKAAPVAYYKPIAEDDGTAPSLFVNQMFVKGYFQGVTQTRLTLIITPARPPR